MAEELQDIGQWRPITIGSVMLRAFSNMLTKRLQDVCPIHWSQKGFSETKGCSRNLIILHGVISRKKSRSESLAVVFIDLAKAFDSVSHKHIEEVLVRRGVDALMRGLIRDSYRGCSTRIGTIEGDTSRIGLQVGVKQGDPMSPLLFNLALDPLLRMLKKRGEGVQVGSNYLTSLAYIDDLVLLSHDWSGMALNLAILGAFCRLSGLSVNPKKCHGFLLSGHG